MGDVRACTSLSIRLADEAATQRLARQLATTVTAGDLLALSGGLGAGKTTLARAFIRHLTRDEEVPSPTFTLLQQYDAPEGSLWHYDLYRLKAPDEIWELGFEDRSAALAVLIEWPDRLGPLLPEHRLDLTLEMGEADAVRTAILTPHGGCRWLDRLAPLVVP